MNSHALQINEIDGPIWSKHPLICLRWSPFMSQFKNIVVMRNFHIIHFPIVIKIFGANFNYFICYDRIDLMSIESFVNLIPNKCVNRRRAFHRQLLLKSRWIRFLIYTTDILRLSKSNGIRRLYWKETRQEWYYERYWIPFWRNQ